MPRGIVLLGVVLSMSNENVVHLPGSLPRTTLSPLVLATVLCLQLDVESWPTDRTP